MNTLKRDSEILKIYRPIFHFERFCRALKNYFFGLNNKKQHSKKIINILKNFINYENNK